MANGSTLLGLLTGGKYQTSKDIPPLTTTKGHKELQWLIDRNWGGHGLEYQGGVDPAVANLALNPLVTAKQIPSLLKIIKKIGLKNPLYHFTSAPKAQKIFKTGKIAQSGKFPGRERERGAFSVTRDPLFAYRPHQNIGTDIRLIMDRDELIRKGRQIRPFAENYRYQKTFDRMVSMEAYKRIHGYYPTQMNPRFEFEERVLGSLPTSDIKMIDFLRFPKMPLEGGPLVLNKANLLSRILKRDIPIMMSKQARREMKKLGGKELLTTTEFKRLMSSPTYTYEPFKLQDPGFPQLTKKRWLELMETGAIPKRPIGPEEILGAKKLRYLRSPFPPEGPFY